MKQIITAWAIIAQDNKILLVKRWDDKKVFPNCWSFPWWKLEENETLTDCVKREVKEETWYDFEIENKYNFTEYLSNNSYNISHLFIWKVKWNIWEFDAKWFSFDETKNLDIAFWYEEIMREFIS